MRFQVLPALALAALAAGCNTTPEERRAADEAKCRSYGFTRRNDAFAECLQRIDLERRAVLRNDTSFDPWNRRVILYSPGIAAKTLNGPAAARFGWWSHEKRRLALAISLPDG